MPLVGFVDEKRVLPFAMSEEQRRSLSDALKARRARATLECLHEAVLRTSAHGLPYFTHRTKPASCDLDEPSVTRMAVTAAAYWAARRVDGWHVDVEAPIALGTSSVLATAGDFAVAIEVEGVPGERNLPLRRDRLGSAGVAAAWLVASPDHVPEEAAADAPTFLLHGTEKDGYTADVVPGRSTGLSDLVKQLLSGRLVFRPTTSCDEATWQVTTRSDRCYRCNGPFTWYDVSASGRSRCGRPVSVPASTRGAGVVERGSAATLQPETHPRVRRTVQSLSLRAPLAAVTPELESGVFACPACAAPLPDSLLDAMGRQGREDAHTAVQVQWPTGGPGPHWCDAEMPCAELRGYAPPARR